jgi:ubiquinone/menaquinone biosynthesis C-methylase UbiE
MEWCSIACGPGILTAAIAKHASKVVAFDLTPEMLKKAAQGCADAELANVSFREGTATELPSRTVVSMPW